MEYQATLPLFNKPFYSYNFVIDDDDYNFTFRYSDRAKTYLMSIEDSQGQTVIESVKLLTGVSLLRQYALEQFTGQFILVPRQLKEIYEWDVKDGRNIHRTHALVYYVPSPTDNGD
ncbi:MAG: hypothetical protein CMH22_04820 [Methylophaga sp.]|nr:hypothetical protein [Methylophaga sp.]|tara:strand:+ start:62477 stop:62824 length:348 start_codon:yes stop_codon:yes gene_type:complete